MNNKQQPLVSISAKNGAYKNIINALKQLDLSSIEGKSVLIKPNVGRAAKPERGYNTHPQAVSAVIKMVKEAGAKKVAIGESPLVGIDTMKAFEKNGISRVARKNDVELIDFDKYKPVKKSIPGARIVTETKICAPVFEHDFIISVPVAKTHMHTVATLGIKNMKGCLYRHEKVRYHQLEYIDKEYPEKTLDSAISDLATILLPDMTVVDGYMGMEGLGPSGGHMIKSDFAVASFNPVAADLFACLMMGINPTEVPHLRLVAERMGFSLSSSVYKVIQEDWEEHIYPYQRSPKEISVEYKNVVVHDNESCSACLSTLMLFLRRFKHDKSQYLLDDGNFHIAIGKGIDENVKEGTVFVGNCTRKHKEKGIHVPGCPPVPTRIYEAITGVEPEENEPEVE